MVRREREREYKTDMREWYKFNKLKRTEILLILLSIIRLSFLNSLLFFSRQTKIFFKGIS